MLYLVKSYLHLGKHIYKIGFTDNIERRRSHYFYSAPGNELITTREGDELLEKLIHT